MMICSMRMMQLARPGEGCFDVHQGNLPRSRRRGGVIMPGFRVEIHAGGLAVRPATFPTASHTPPPNPRTDAEAERPIPRTRGAGKVRLKSAILRALGRDPRAVPWNSEESIREELFSAERLEAHAESLAAAQGVSARPAAERSLAAR